MRYEFAQTAFHHLSGDFRFQHGKERSKRRVQQKGTEVWGRVFIFSPCSLSSCDMSATVQAGILIFSGSLIDVTDDH